MERRISSHRIQELVNVDDAYFSLLLGIVDNKDIKNEFVWFVMSTLLKVYLSYWWFVFFKYQVNFEHIKIPGCLYK